MAELKPGYKIAEVGVIPEEWTEKKLSEISTVVRGGSPRPAGDPKYFSGDFIPWLTVAALTNIPDFQMYVWESIGFLTEEGSKYSRTLKGDTLIIANSGATLGVAKILKITCCANDGIAALLDLDGVDNRFICYYINSQTKRLREVVATGNGQPNLNTGLIGNILVPLPPLAEQRAIADAISEADDQIAILDDLIAKKRDIKQGTMQRLLTSEERLPGFSSEWKMYSFGDMFEFLNTANNSRSDLSEYGDVEYIHYGDIHMKWNSFLDCEIEELPRIERSKVQSVPYIQDGDLIIADASEDYDGIGASVEVKNMADRKIVAGLHTLLLRGDKSLLADGFKGYLQYIPALRQALIKAATGISVYGISKNNIKKISVRLPETVEQQAIATVLSDMDAEIILLEEQREKIVAIKQGMVQELLTGKTRLI